MGFIPIFGKLGAGATSMNMDIAIFELKASIEATSLYILICALMDQGVAPTLREASKRWTGTYETMIAGAEELVQRCVFNCTLPIPRDKHLHPTTRDRWC